MSPFNKDAEFALEEATIQHFEALGWESIHAKDEMDGDPKLLGREHQGEVVLKRYLYPALQKFNPGLPEEALDQAVKQLIRDRSAMSIARANHDVYGLIKNGVVVNFRDKDGNDTTERIKIVDWNSPENNHFLLVSQFWVAGDPYRRRADLVGFVNGIPLLFIELKAPHENIKHAFDDNLKDYKSTIPQLLWYNAFIILSNGAQTKIGSVTSPWEHFADWKKINEEGEAGVISLDTIIRGTCEKKRFLDIVENFCIFQEALGGLIKLLAKNHQYLGVNNAIEAVNMVQQNKGRLGVFWHTQGAGKSASMIFFSQKILRKMPGNWTFVIVTDRKELDDQIYKTCKDSGIITEGHVQARSSTHLRQLLAEDHRFVFTLIHKFRTENGEKHPVLSLRDDIIVITDEAHRSQYDILAQNMRDALPNASFIGFTGTPLIKGEEEKTREVFGDYVSIYNFSQSIEDGATVPLYYENRIPEVQLTVYGKEHMNERMYHIIEEAMLDVEQEKKLELEFGRMYHIITRDDRLEKISENIVEHFMGRGHRGKAMYVAIDKATAVKMYDKVSAHWKETIEDLKRRLKYTRGDESRFLQEEIKYMEMTDMAVVVSPGQNEVEEMRLKGVDILTHRKRMVKEDLDKKFKDPDDPFRLVFVCAMWMTGFDVPSCSTIYLDKPMRNHTLMQTIARANRVFQDKPNGLIVDYVGVFRNLEKALAIYAAPSGGREDLPIKNKDELKTKLDQAIHDVKDFLKPFGVDLEAIRKEKDVFKRVALKDEAVNHILVNDDSKKEYLHKADIVKKIYKAYLPDPIEAETAETAYLIRRIAKSIRSIVEPPKVDHVMADIDALLDKSVEGFVMEEPEGGYRSYDLSQIDFEALRKKFEKARKQIVMEQLKKAIEEKLKCLIQANRTRMDFVDKFKQLIDEYNAGASSVEEIFRKLLEFAQKLKEEEKRFMREGLQSDEELAVFDILTKPDMTLSQKEIKQVKRIARSLLENLKTQKLVLDWKKKQQTRAGVKLAIADILDQLPAAYTKDIYEQKCDAVYQFVYDLELGAEKVAQAYSYH